MNMIKKSCLAMAMMAMTIQAMAGGLLTNTNQSASFDRMLSQNGMIDITALYVNPAGTAFLKDGWHLSLNMQSAIQSRDIQTTFPLFALNNGNHSTTHEFKGDAVAPVIPSFQLSYNKDKWSVNANFALGGGGGKCEFKQGLGSFEALYGGNLYQLVPQAVLGKVPGIVSGKLQQLSVPATMADQIAASGAYTATLTGYDMNAYMKGRQYYFGLQLGGTYKFTDNFAAFGGVRFVYATCNYNGYVQDVKANYAYTYKVPGNAALGLPDLNGEGTGSEDLANMDLTLNCEQEGFGVTPIIGFDWKINNHWNVSAKYEFKTRLRLTNTSEMNSVAKQQAAQEGNVLAQFADGKSVAEDIPALLTFGGQYAPLSNLRINAGFNLYFDKSATKYGDKQNQINDNTTEITAGVEYDINKYITVSGSWQKTNYGLSDQYMNDLSFNLSSNSMGVGMRINATKRCSIDVAYMHTFYGDRTVDQATAAGTKTDVYSRNNNVFAVGVNLAF